MNFLKDILARGTGFHPGIPVAELMTQYTTAESDFLDVEGMRLHYRVTGSGPELVLLHGVASSLHTWNRWQNLLSASFRVISIDVPGFGLTGPHPAGEYSVDMYNRVLNALLDHLGLESVFMAGNSFGGFLTWNFAVDFPHRVRKIILQDAAGLNSRSSDISDAGFMLATMDTTRRLTYTLTPRSLVRASIRNATTPNFPINETLVERYYQLLLRKGNRKAFSEILRNLIYTNKDQTERIMTITTPTLIQWGENDTLIDIGFAYLFERAIEGSRLIIYKDTGHLPMEEIPELSAKDAEAFFLDDQS